MRKFDIKRYFKQALSKIGPAKDMSTFCSLPWNHVFIGEMGHSYPCCIATDSSLANKDEKGVAYRIHNPAMLEKAWNSQYMKDIRRQMLSGERPAPCVRCYKFEDLGILSHRQMANTAVRGRLSALAESTRSDYSAPLSLRSLDIRLGNNCNLKCRMCSPYSSKGLTEEWRKLYALDEAAAADYMSVNWYKNEGLWDLLLENSENLRSLHFAGGEPFLIKEQYTFLRRLVEKGLAKKLAITYNTNLTVIPEELPPLWREFKSIQLMVSIDGTEAVNHYIRYPTKWSKFIENIRYVYNLDSSYNLLPIDFCVAVQNYNIFNLPELIEFLMREFPKAHFPRLSPLFSPPELSVQVLPPALKRVATERILFFLRQHRVEILRNTLWLPHSFEFIRNIEGLIEFMNKSDETHLLPTFIRRTQFFDFSREQSCAAVIPELASLFQTPLHLQELTP